MSKIFSSRGLACMVRRFRTANAGGVLVLFAISIGVLVSAVMLSTEMANYTRAKSKFKQAVDESVLAAASSNAENELDYATEYLRANLDLNAAAYHGDVLRGRGGITVNNFTVKANEDRTEWRAIAEGTVATSFAQILGITTLPLRHTALVAWDKDSRSEIVGMIDVSGFGCTKVQAVGAGGTFQFVQDTSCEKMRMMRDALKGIMNIGVSYAANDGLVTDPIYKVGIVPFSYKVNLENTSNLPTLLTQAEDGYMQFGGGQNYYKNLSDAEAEGAAPLPKVIPLTSVKNASDKSTLESNIDKLMTPDSDPVKKEFNRPFMTRPTLGTYISALMLDPDYHAMFGGETPVAFGTKQTDKIVIMLSDASHLGCCFTNINGDFSKSYVYSYQQDHDAMLRSDGLDTICTAMKKQGIEIYTILFDVTADQANATGNGSNILSGFRACASDSEHAYTVPSGPEAQKTLNGITQVVGRAIMKLRLAE